MGMLVDGLWRNQNTFPTKQGAFERPASVFRDTVTTDGRFQPALSRYHLIVSYACPWAHRTLIMRQLKGLTAVIPISVVCPEMLTHGWTWSQQHPGSHGFDLYPDTYLYQLYQRVNPHITTRVTVPILWDTEEQTIVNNESADIVRIFNSAFDTLTGNTDDFYPQRWRCDIDQWHDRIYQPLNNGVYRCGFATSQSAYDAAIDELYACLEHLEAHLAHHETLVGNRLTEADVRLIPTLLRFDDVYHTHFKCSRKRIYDYPHLRHYVKSMLRIEAIRQTTRRDHIQRHYYVSHTHINPYQIIAACPTPSLFDGT